LLKYHPPLEWQKPFYPIAQAHTLSGRVVRQIDRDTLVILDASRTQHKIRLQGIDAPERRQVFGTKSNEYLTASVAGQVVVVEYSDLTAISEYWAMLLLDGTDINLKQASSGMDWHLHK